jgi:hypothetical protein
MSFRTPYQGYDVLEKWDSPSWNDATRRVVRRRLAEVPPRRFFSEAEWRLLEAICERLVPQPDRPEAPVPIVPWIDEKLELNHTDGYRYADMPPLREAWRLGLEGIAREAERRHDAPYESLGPVARDAILAAVHQGKVSGAPWDRVAPKHFFKFLLKTVLGAYYSHPAAWSEAGYGGPASPRGYVRLDADKRDPWEAEAKE